MIQHALVLGFAIRRRTRCGVSKWRREFQIGDRPKFLPIVEILLPLRRRPRIVRRLESNHHVERLISLLARLEIINSIIRCHIVYPPLARRYRAVHVDRTILVLSLANERRDVVKTRPLLLLPMMPLAE